MKTKGRRALPGSNKPFTIAGQICAVEANAGRPIRTPNRHLNGEGANVTHALNLFECHTNSVLLDPDCSAVENDAAILSHKLKPIGDVARIRYINSRPISGDILNITVDANSIATYARRAIDCCSRILPIFGHDEPPWVCSAGPNRAKEKWQDKYAKPYLDLLDEVLSERDCYGLSAVCGVQLDAKLACYLVDEMF